MILIVDNKSLQTSELKKYLRNRKIKFVTAKKNSRLKNIMKHHFKGVILTGGAVGIYSKVDMNKIAIDLAVLLDLSVPVLGICLGHQLIAEAFDGRVEKLKKRICKKEKIKVVKGSALFKGLPEKFEMLESHSGGVSELPYNFHLLAKSKQCPVEAIKHKSKHIYGTQFHPEASGEPGEKLLDNFMKICKIKVHKPKRTKKK